MFSDLNSLLLYAAPLRSDSTFYLSLEVIQEHTSARNYQKEHYKKKNLPKNR